MAPPDVHLVFGGFLIDGVVKVNRVGVLQPVVPPEQHTTKNQQTNKSCIQEREVRQVRPDSRLLLLLLLL